MPIKKSKLMRAYIKSGRDIEKTIASLTQEVMASPDEFPDLMEAAIKGRPYSVVKSGGYKTM